MDDKNEQAMFDALEIEEESFDFDELEEKLQGQLEEELADLQFLSEEREKIGNPDQLGNVIRDVILDVVQEQIDNQLMVAGGEAFIKENNGLRLDLRNSAHIQTVENFEQQKYATHNAYIDYKKRGEEFRSNFYTDPNNKPAPKQNQPQRYNETTKVWETYDNIDGEWKKALREEYRKPYEKDRNKDKKNKLGNKTINKDHQVPTATIARDPEASAYMTLEEKVQMANSESNLFDLDSSANQSKSDHDGEKWIKHKRTGKSGKGQKESEHFGIDENKYIEQDKKAKEAIEQTKKKKKAENIALGKQSQKEEALRISGAALKTVLAQLLNELLRDIVAKLVVWFKSAKKGFNTLLDSLKEAIHTFLGKMKQNLINAGNTTFGTVAAAIIGPVFRVIKKVETLLKQGFRSVKDAVLYLKNPANKGKPIGLLLMEVGKIIIAGLTVTGALLLSEAIEKSLMTIPVFTVVIPFLGSLASILSIFFGAVVAGIIGAIAINLIEKMSEKRLKRDNTNAQFKKRNEILNLQHKVEAVGETKLDHTRDAVANDIHFRHVAAANIMSDSIENIRTNCAIDETVEVAFDDIDSLFGELGD